MRPLSEDNEVCLRFAAASSLLKDDWVFWVNMLRLTVAERTKKRQNEARFDRSLILKSETGRNAPDVFIGRQSRSYQIARTRDFVCPGVTGRQSSKLNTRCNLEELALHVNYDPNKR